MSLQRFQQYVEQQREWFQGHNPETTSGLLAAEQRLQVKLPLTLKWLLSHQGYWRATGVAGLPYVVRTTLAFRPTFPSSWIVLARPHIAAGSLKSLGMVVLVVSETAPVDGLAVIVCGAQGEILKRYSGFSAYVRACQQQMAKKSQENYRVCYPNFHETPPVPLPWEEGIFPVEEFQLRLAETLLFHDLFGNFQHGPDSQGALHESMDWAAESKHADSQTPPAPTAAAEAESLDEAESAWEIETVSAEIEHICAAGSTLVAPHFSSLPFASEPSRADHNEEEVVTELPKPVLTASQNIVAAVQQTVASSPPVMPPAVIPDPVAEPVGDVRYWESLAKRQRQLQQSPLGKSPHVTAGAEPARADGSRTDGAAPEAAPDQMLAVITLKRREALFRQADHVPSEFRSDTSSSSRLRIKMPEQLSSGQLLLTPLPGPAETLPAAEEMSLSSLGLPLTQHVTMIQQNLPAGVRFWVVSWVREDQIEQLESLLAHSPLQPPLWLLQRGENLQSLIPRLNQLLQTEAQITAGLT